MISSVEERNFETFILKKTQDKIVGAYLEGVILHRLRDRQLSGYDLLKTLQNDYNLLVSPGTMYSTIYALEREGFIESTQNGRKRVYQLTDKGKTTIQIISQSKNLKNLLFMLAKEFFSE